MRNKQGYKQSSEARFQAPPIPEDITFAMLPRVSQARLRGLSKDLAQVVGQHIVASQQLISAEPELAYLHAQAAARKASRVEFARETLGIVAYQLGNYKVALRELRTARRINGYNDYLPIMADCERGLGNPEKALAIAASPEAKELGESERIEMTIVAAGARADLGEMEAGLALLNREMRSRGLSTPCRLRLMEAKALFLDRLGRVDEAEQIMRKVDAINEKYEDPRDEEVVVYDLEDDEDVDATPNATTPVVKPDVMQENVAPEIKAEIVQEPAERVQSAAVMATE